MRKIGAWINAFRLRTLPLSFSSVIIGSFLAFHRGFFQMPVLIGALLTTLFLQILSNLANDYGDTVHGVDNHLRTGPKRSVQSGAISRKEMRAAIGIFTGLSLVSGVWLLVKGTQGLQLSSAFILFAIGIAAIAAAIKYTIGKRPYGYIGLGDVAVFVFFGLTGVLGTYFLHTHQITPHEFLPAISIGLFSTGVLNLNNLRDHENDRNSGKRTLIVLMGVKNGKLYHALLIVCAIISALIFTALHYRNPGQLIYLVTIPFFIRNIVAVFKNTKAENLDPELKRLALTTLFFAITFGYGLTF